MYRTFCNNLCCLLIAVILGGMTAGLVHFHQKSEEGISFSAGFPETAPMVLSGPVGQDAVRSFIPSSGGSMETCSVTVSAPAPGQMSQKCQGQAPGCSQISFSRTGHFHEATLSFREEPASRLSDYYIFALGRIMV